jgi:hypothetical protein
MGKKNGFLRNSAGELVLWCNGTEVMACDTSKLSFFAAAPVAQAAHIADAGDTSGGDEKEHINAKIVVNENLGLVATS